MPPAGDTALRDDRQQVSSKFIRREAALTAADQAHAKVISQRFSILRTRVLREMRNRGWRKLAVVPVTHGAGATYVAVNLALALARQQHTRVMLLDMDLGSPSVAQQMRIPGCDPIAEALHSGSPISALVRSIEEAPNLSVLAPEVAEVAAAEMLQDDVLASSFAGLIDAMPTNTVAVMDMAALVGDDEALAALPLADAILLVADGRNGTAADMAQAERLLIGMPPVMGVILNKSED